MVFIAQSDCGGRDAASAIGQTGNEALRGHARLAIPAVMREKGGESGRAGRSRIQPQMKSLFALLLSVALLVSGIATAASSPAAMISDFRQKHGEGRVILDATLNRIAQEQAKAMAAKDMLDHAVLGSFSSRIAPSKAGRAAENIAYGYPGFEKTLGQWINSTEHRRNLLLHNASRIGVASATSAVSHRTYWAMEIAGDYQPRPILVARKTRLAVVTKPAVRSCRIKILGLCL
jgi:hypothetical protein